MTCSNDALLEGNRKQDKIYSCKPYIISIFRWSEKRSYEFETSLWKHRLQFFNMIARIVNASFNWFNSLKGTPDPGAGVHDLDGRGSTFQVTESYHLL